MKRKNKLWMERQAATEATRASNQEAASQAALRRQASLELSNSRTNTPRKPKHKLGEVK